MLSLGSEKARTSFIEYDNLRVFTVDHTEKEYLDLIEYFYLTISDGQILIKALKSDRVFLLCKEQCKDVLKSELMKMTVKRSNEQHFFRIGEL